VWILPQPDTCWLPATDCSGLRYTNRMPLVAGMRLGPYEIVAPIGAGGMGEVYRALDTRLSRTVAIKVLPPHAAGNPEVRQRFEREARAVSSLNHPHICALYDVGTQDGVDYLVMEHLEGETLGSRLSRGPLAVPEVLRYAVEMADALALAHRQGVYHRDLKPGNVMLTKAGAKLLDFGLAKLRAPAPGAGTLSSLPTQGMDLTQKGSILGTFQYMPPEQLEGKDTDARSDIFSFGAVLYEMVTGRKAFDGRSQASLITQIMSTDPPAVSTLVPAAPPAVEHIVRKCLAKDPDERWQTAADLAGELKWIGGSTPAAPAVEPAAVPERRRNWLPWAVAALAAAAALAIGFVHWRETPPKLPSARFTIALPEKAGLQWYDYATVSPDGERVAFTAWSADGRGLLWVRPLGSLAAQPLPGTDAAYFPFWSPDSRSLAFFAAGKLKRIDLAGGPPQSICDITTGAGGTWNRDGVIVFRPAQGPLHRVAAAGGESRPVSTLESGQTTHVWPSFLPDGRRFLYYAASSRAETRGVYVGSLDSKEVRKLPVARETAAIYAEPGYLLFGRGGALMAQTFDARKAALTGDSFPVAEQVAVLGSNAGVACSASANGVLVLRSGVASINIQMAWFDREGKRLGVVGEPADYSNPALSPDGKRLAVGRRDPTTRTRDIWVFDLVRGASSRLTFDPAEDMNPLFSPDGTRIAFASERKGLRNLYLKNASGAGQDEPLFESDLGTSAEDWTADGKFLVFNGTTPKTGVDLWALPLTGDRKPVLAVEGPGRQEQGRVSPNGRWIAYRSNESGRDEIFVQPFRPGSAATGKWQVSTAGGWEPAWRGDSKELYYLTDTKLMAVDVKPEGASFEAGIPKPLFDVRLASTQFRNRYVVSADGRRFLVSSGVEETGTSPFQVVTNWTAGVKR